MSISPPYEEYRRGVREFVNEHVLPHATRFDAEEQIPDELVRRLGAAGYLAEASDMLSFAVLNEELGRGCSSVRSLITVHSMVSYAVSRWGTAEQQARWLPQLATGEAIGAFALSEPQVGSDAKSVELDVRADGDRYVANGRKQWITFGQIADVFLVFGSCEGHSVAFLADRTQPGLVVEPISGMLGTRASMLASLQFDDFAFGESDLLGRPGFGLAAVGYSALNLGRLSVAAGSVGIMHSCVESCLSYARERAQFGKPIIEHQLVQRMLADMTTQLTASRLMCHHAARSLEAGAASAPRDVMAAKYFCAKAAADVTRDGVQIHGATGCSAERPVARLYRDAKVMEIIEGSNEILQSVLGAGAVEGLSDA